MFLRHLGLEELHCIERGRSASHLAFFLLAFTKRGVVVVVHAHFLHLLLFVLYGGFGLGLVFIGHGNEEEV